ncbi:MAG: LppX_LprAFG lipoprotein [Chloroflexi bacterium]|nr:LppX_LprAFG lipoprotein [Chloroflexota bacterium]
MQNWWRKLTVVAGCLILVVGIAACKDSSDDKKETPVDPAALMQDAASRIDQAQSFRLLLAQEGPATVIDNDLELAVTFNSADAIFVQPDRVFAKVSVSIEALTQEVQIIAVGENQYVNNRFLTNDQWLLMTFAHDFSPADLQSADQGIGNALRSAQNVQLVGEEDLDGVPVYHLKAVVEANKVRSVTVGLIGSREGMTEIDIYIRTRDKNLAQIRLNEPALLDAESQDPTIWTISFAGYGNYETEEIQEPTVEAGDGDNAEATPAN